MNPVERRLLRGVAVLRQKGKGLVSLSWLCILFLAPARCPAQWVAFNDHAAGTNTHVNATRWNVFGTTSGAPGNSGFLKNIMNGTNVPVTLTIVNNGATSAGGQGNAAAGSPAYATFNGYVDFMGAPNPSVELTNTRSVTYRISGLDPGKRYQFAGTAIRGGAGYENRWTLFELGGAEGFRVAHTRNAYTTGLLANQVAINTGVNNTAATGDMALWENIAPGSDGIIEVISSQYSGPIPGGGSANGAKTYALTGFRLEELNTSNAPVTLVLEPSDQTVTEGSAAILQVGAVGYPLSFQWFKDALPLSGATNSSYLIPSAALTDAGIYFAIVSNQFNSVTSRVATVTVQKDPIVRVLGLTNSWKYDCSGRDVGSDWLAPAYDESGWSNGTALFYNETASLPGPKNTFLPLTNAAGERIVTYYFRTHFTWSNDASAFYLVSSNLVDDGAIAYLNGKEIFRFNLPNGPVGASTLAVSNSTEGAFVPLSFITTNLVAGDNLLAVEVHQVATNSSDVVFSMVLNAVPLQEGPAILLKALEPREATAGDTVAFAAQAAGQLPLYYQWRFNGVDLPGMTNQWLILSNAWMAHDGFYSVRVANALGVAASFPIRLSVRSPGVLPCYTNDFENSVGPEWSSASTQVTPVGARRFLGEFGQGNQSATLSLSNLPPHSHLSIAVDLFTLLSWDGTPRGSDSWEMNVEGGPVLLNAVFQVHNTYTTAPFPSQSFPDPASNPIYPAYTGASEVGSLGYFYNSHAEDAVYRLVYTFPHSNSVVRLNFVSDLDEPISNESWGMDNVAVYFWADPNLRLARTGQTLTLNVDGVPGTQARVVYSEDLGTPAANWLTLTNVAVPAKISPALDVGQSSRRFYRAVRP